VIIVLGLLLRAVYLKRWATAAEVPDETTSAQEEKIQKEEPAPPVAAAISETAPAAEILRAKLVLPGGSDIALTGGSRSIGRAEMGRALNLDELCLVSRKQFTVSFKDNSYFIEDTGGPNSTILNGEAIKDRGEAELKDGDTIEVAGVIKLKFVVQEP
jgi:pSer/pThr/pTyr-binding forkhead associated (FHA) protein